MFPQIPFANISRNKIRTRDKVIYYTRCREHKESRNNCERQMLGGLESERLAPEFYWDVKQELINIQCKGNLVPVQAKKAYGRLEV
jgi:hypothetical protein